MTNPVIGFPRLDAERRIDLGVQRPEYVAAWHAAEADYGRTVADLPGAMRRRRVKAPKPPKAPKPTRAVTHDADPLNPQRGTYARVVAHLRRLTRGATASEVAVPLRIGTETARHWLHAALKNGLATAERATDLRGGPLRFRATSSPTPCTCKPTSTPPTP